MSYSFPCECGRTATVEAGQAGTTVTCPCGRAHTVPSLTKLRQTPPTRTEFVQSMGEESRTEFVIQGKELGECVEEYQCEDCKTHMAVRAESPLEYESTSVRAFCPKCTGTECYVKDCANPATEVLFHQVPVHTDKKGRRFLWKRGLKLGFKRNDTCLCANHAWFFRWLSRAVNVLVFLGLVLALPVVAASFVGLDQLALRNVWVRVVFLTGVASILFGVLLGGCLPTLTGLRKKPQFTYRFRAYDRDEGFHYQRDTRLL